MDDEKPLPFPFTMPDAGGRRWGNKRPEEPGVWKAWECAGVLGWTLKCLPVFQAEIRYEAYPKAYFLCINDVAMGQSKELEPLQDRAEREMIARVRGMLPAYRVIHERIMKRQGTPGTG